MSAGLSSKLSDETTPKRHRLYQRLEENGKLNHKRCTWPALAILEAIYNSSNKDLKELRGIIQEKYDEPTLMALDPTFFLKHTYTKNDQQDVVKKATIMRQGEFKLQQQQCDEMAAQLRKEFQDALSKMRKEFEDECRELRNEASSLRILMNNLRDAVARSSSNAISNQLAILETLDRRTHDLELGMTNEPLKTIEM